MSQYVFSYFKSAADWIWMSQYVFSDFKSAADWIWMSQYVFSDFKSTDDWNGFGHFRTATLRVYIMSLSECVTF